MSRWWNSSMMVLMVVGVACSGSTPYTGQPSPELRAMEERVHELVNEYRMSRRLPSLRHDTFIADVCREHSRAMASGRVGWGHEGFDQRIRKIKLRIEHMRSAENVAFNLGFDDPAGQALQSWLESPGHLENILGEFDLTGVGIARSPDGTHFFTQIFLKRK